MVHRFQAMSLVAVAAAVHHSVLYYQVSMDATKELVVAVVVAPKGQTQYLHLLVQWKLLDCEVLHHSH